MSSWTFLSDQSGATRNVLLGGIAAVALVCLALLGWWSLAPTPSELVEQNTPIKPGAQETTLAPSEPDAAPSVQDVTVPDQVTAAEPDRKAEQATQHDAPQTPEVSERPDTLTDVARDSREMPVPADDEPETRTERGTQDAQEATEQAAVPPTALEEPAPRTAQTAPAFEIVRVEETGDAVIAGRAEAGQTVRILLDGESVAEASADATGAFVALISLAPSQMARTLTLESVGETGAPVPSQDTALIAPFAAPSASEDPEQIAGLAPPTEPDLPSTPQDALPRSQAAPGRGADGLDGSPGPVTAPPAPVQDVARLETPPQVVIVAPDGAVPQAPAAAPARPDAPDTANVVIDTISYDAEGEVVLVGRAQQGSFVRLYLDNTLQATVPVPQNGTWRSRVTGIAAGVYALRADETGDDGQVMSRFETPFERVTRPRAIAAVQQAAQADTDPDGTPLEASAGIVTVQPGFTLWAIARANYGDGVQYVRVFEANRSQIRDPDLIYPGQVFSVPEQ